MAKKASKSDPTTTTPVDTTPPASFERGVEELEAILEQLDSGAVGLDQALSKHARAAFLLNSCRTILDDAEARIEQLSKPQNTAAGLNSDPNEPAEA